LKETENMRRYRWLIILFVLIAACIVAAGYAIAPTAKRVLVSQVEQTTGLRPSVERVGVSVWRGTATAYDVVLPNPKPFREPTLVNARSITVNVALLPLLSRRVIVQQITLLGAELTVERNRQGRSNLQALQERLQSQKKPGGEAPPVRVDKVIFEDSTVRFIDYGAPSPPAKLVVKDIKATLRNIDSARAKELLPSPFSAQGVIDTPRPGRLVAKGRTNPFVPLANFDLQLTLQRLDLPALQSLSPPQSVVILEGLSDLTTSATSRQYNLNAHNRLVLNNLDLKPKGRGGQVAGLPLSTVVDFLQREDIVELEFDVTGDVRNPKANLHPAVERLVAKALKDRILSSPKTLLEAGKIGTGTGAKPLETSKKVGEAGVEGVKRLGSGLKKLFGR
jgi:uncharacterized protein involved in outer membrane biogenesis